MIKPVKFANPAVREIKLAKKYYQLIRRSLMMRFLGEVDDAIAAMIERPDSFAEYLHGTRRILLNKFPYLVVFQDLDDHFFVIAIAHEKRKPGYWKRRLK